jgi:ADP-ribose pyrophosphatase
MREPRIPKEAKLVFKGVIFEVWQWEQKMFDGTRQTFEMLRRPDTASVLAVVGDKILLQKEEQPHRPPFVTVPGGRCDEGEEPLEAARRELLEETGYASDDMELLAEHHPPGKIDWVLYSYVARNCRKVAEPHPDSGERIETMLVSFEELLEYSDDPNFRATEIREILLRARNEPDKREALRVRLFGNA